MGDILTFYFRVALMNIGKIAVTISQINRFQVAPINVRNKPMKKTQTQRGFDYYNFVDANGVKCSIQKSSAAEDLIWLGADKIGLKAFHPNTDEPWRDVDLGGQDHVANNRMHLNQEQIEKLLPILKKFVETGEI